MITSVTTALIALIATLAGIAGDTWDKTKTGWRRLTRKGYLVIAVGLATFIVAIVQAKAEAARRDQQEAKDRLLLSAASAAIFDAMQDLVRPFNLAIRESRFSNDPAERESIVFNRFFSTPFQDIVEIASPEFTRTLDEILATGCPREFGRGATCEWADIFARDAASSDKAMERIIKDYAGILDTATLKDVVAIRNHPMLLHLMSAASMVEHARQQGQDVRGITMSWIMLGPHEPEDEYVPFFRLVKDLLRRAGARIDTTTSQRIRRSRSAAETTRGADTTQTQKDNKKGLAADDGLGSLSTLRIAAEGGDAVAQRKLGIRYSSGAGVERSPRDAARWYRRAALQGDAIAQGLLAVSYANGQGVTANRAEAIKWFRLSGEQGNILSQFSLGVLYEGETNFTEAAKWYRLAATKGYAKSQFNLGSMYDKGQLGGADFVHAYLWFSIAAASSSAEVREPAAERLKRIVDKMSAAELDRAQGLEVRCRSSSYTKCD
jgi:hypothetical protein